MSENLVGGWHMLSITIKVDCKKMQEARKEIDEVGKSLTDVQKHEMAGLDIGAGGNMERTANLTSNICKEVSHMV